jgi:hypothetical protein
MNDFLFGSSFVTELEVLFGDTYTPTLLFYDIID